MAAVDPVARDIEARTRVERRVADLERAVARGAQVPAGGVATVTTNASGVATVTHGLPFTPSGVVPAVVGTANAWVVSVDNPNITATTFRVVVRTGAGVAVASTSVTLNWIAFP